MPGIESSIPLVYPARAPVPVTASRALTGDDNGQTLECTPGITLSVPEGLPDGFQVNIAIVVAAGGTVVLDPTGTTKVNDATANVSLESTRPAMWCLFRNAAANQLTCPV